MARDRMLLQRGIGARVYTWSKPWVTLGCFQSASDAILSSAKVQWSRRPTGGRAVLHGHDVTVAMVLALDEPRGVRIVYPVIVGILVKAIRSAGVPAYLGREFVGERPTMRTADCFAAVSSNDIVNELGQKVCGCALKLTSTSILVQASIPVSEPLVDPGTVYAAPASIHPIDLDPQELVGSLKSVLANRNWELGLRPAPSHV